MAPVSEVQDPDLKSCVGDIRMCEGETLCVFGPAHTPAHPIRSRIQLSIKQLHNILTALNEKSKYAPKHQNLNIRTYRTTLNDRNQL